MPAKPAATTAKPSIVRLALPVPLPTLFDYSVRSEQQIPPIGARVQVPFGPRRLIGLCVEQNPEDPHPKPRPITNALDSKPLLSEHLLAMARWLADYYHHPLGEVLATMLPVAARQGAATNAREQQGWRLAADAGTAPDLGRAAKQKTLLAFFQSRADQGQQTPITDSALREQGYSSAVVQALAKRGLIERLAFQPEYPAVSLTPSALQLNDEQTAALRVIRQHSGYHTTLVEGVTGSGKTEIYLQLIADVIARGQQALVLVPEIALTPQTVARFAARFGSAAALHSALGDTERWHIWLGCRDGSIKVVIGTRSASLTPFANLGLIVVDEEHDSSFKQTDGLRYSARDLVVKRAFDLKIPLVLGSATPALESLHNVAAGRYQKVVLSKRAGSAQMPQYHLLDIRGQQTPDGISEPLRRVIGQHLDAGNQALLFINRRGFSPSYLCARCGQQSSCSACERPLTFHKNSRLECHHCGLQRPATPLCEHCDGAMIPVGAGTQRTEERVAELFPDFPVYRIDRDSVRSQRQLEAQFAKIHEGHAALLVGTQQLAKGHHFPDVTLVAVLNADAGFASPDFRAPERTAQLIVQVAGRAGRGDKPGEVWVQTLQPESPLLTGLVARGYPGFAAQELQRRELAALPPYGCMALLRAESTQSASAKALLDGAKSVLRQAQQRFGVAVQIAGPVPAPMPRVANRWRFQLMLLAATRRPLHQCLAALRAGIKAPRDVRWSIDVDPYDAF